MINKFKDFKYLINGNNQQKLAYEDIVNLDIFEKLKKYNPILVGTIPIEIDLPESDLDIICESKNHSEFSGLLSKLFGNETEFKIDTTRINGVKTTIAEFKTENFIFEIFGQNIPTEKQNAYRHMIIENQILKEKGIEFKQKIIKLKASGLKTEPAFAKLLGLKGDPYDELLKLE